MTIKKVKEKQGIYRNLKKELIKERTFQNTLRISITAIVEDAFRKYCKAHKADKKLEDLEWTRFNKYLQKNL